MSEKRGIIIHFMDGSKKLPAGVIRGASFKD